MGVPLEVGLGSWTLEAMPPLHRSWPLLYRDLLRNVRCADALGFDTFWLGEHHHIYTGGLPSQFPALASCLAATERIKMGAGVVLLPLHGPRRVAEGAAAVNSIAPNRLRVALGMGHSEREYRAGGVDHGRRGRIFEEYLQAAIAECRERSGINDIWVGAVVPRAIGRAARFGCSLYLVPARLDPRHLSEIRQQWEAELEPRADHVPRFGLGVAVWVTDDESAARRSVERWHEQVRHSALDRSRFPVVAGSADQVMDTLAPMVSEGGADALHLFVNTPLAGSDEVEAQMEVLAGAVVPQLRALR